MNLRNSGRSFKQMIWVSDFNFTTQKSYEKLTGISTFMASIASDNNNTFSILLTFSCANKNGICRAASHLSLSLDEKNSLDFIIILWSKSKKNV